MGPSASSVVYKETLIFLLELCVSLLAACLGVNLMRSFVYLNLFVYLIVMAVVSLCHSILHIYKSFRYFFTLYFS